MRTLASLPWPAWFPYHTHTDHKHNIIMIMKSVRSPDINCSNKQFTVGFSVLLCSLLPQNIPDLRTKEIAQASYSAGITESRYPTLPHPHLHPPAFTAGRNCCCRKNEAFALPPLSSRLCFAIAKFQELFGCN